MKKYGLLIVIPFGLFFSCKPTGSKNVSPSIDSLAIKNEVRAFMDKYQSLAKASDFEKVAALYDSSGASFVSLEDVVYESYDSIKSSYAQMANDTITYLEWKEPMIIDPIRNDVVIVSGGYVLFVNQFIDTFKSRYSAVLVKTANGWKIKHENEMPEVYTAKKLVDLWESKKK